MAVYPLPTLAAQIDRHGIAGPSFVDILASLQASYRQIYGSEADLAPDTQDGQWLGIQAQVIYDLNQTLIMAYLSYSPSYAQGIGLSSIVKINGIRRLLPSHSTAPLRLVGVVGTVITDGIVQDVNRNLWYLPHHVVIPIAGEVMATATAQNPGSLRANPNTINIIYNPQPGWQSASNPNPASVGYPTEDDAQLRQRQSDSTAIVAITPRISILAALANLRGVGRVEVYDNDTNLTDSNGVPPHSIAVVIEGGDTKEIAETIHLKKNTGCGTWGDVHMVVNDQIGVPHAIDYWQLHEVPIYVDIHLTPREGYLNNYGRMAAKCVVDFMNQLPIGHDVYAHWFYAPAELSGDVPVETLGLTQEILDLYSETYIIRAIYTGTAPDPTTNDDIIIGFNQAALGSEANVKITLV